MDIYADDTTVSSSASSNEIPKLQEALFEDLQKVEKWSRTNNMYLNPSKTKAMLAVGKRLRKRFDGETSSLQAVSLKFLHQNAFEDACPRPA